MDFTVYDVDGFKQAEIANLRYAVYFAAAVVGPGATVRLKFKKTVVIFQEDVDAYDGYDDCEISDRLRVAKRNIERLREVGLKVYLKEQEGA